MKQLLMTCALAALAHLPAQTVQLAEGRLLLAKVEDANGDGLRVKRLDNGGVLDLRWDQLSPASALKIKREFNLAGDTQDEILVRADEVEYLIGGRKQTVLGKIVQRTDKEVVVQQRGVPFRIPRSEIKGVRTLDVPVAEIYTKDEWYAIRLTELSDPSKADQHLLLVEDLIKVRDYQHAGEHLEIAGGLGNTIAPERLESLTTKLARYKEAAKERELLDEIQACRSRGTLSQFQKGVDFIARFEQEFPTTRLKAEFDVEKKRFFEARKRYLAQKVADNFRRSIRTIAEKKVMEAGITLQSVRDYAENQMSDDLFARMAQQFSLEEDEVKELWAAREEYPVGKRTEHFAYNLGSWVLGEKAILKDTNVEKAKGQQPDKSANDPNSRQVEQIQRAIKQALERRRAASQGAGQGQREQTDEDWWREASRAERVGWLRAYYAEFGGQLVVTFAAVAPCISCYGQGTTPEVGPDGKIIRVPCFLCHDTKWMRSIKAY